MVIKVSLRKMEIVRDLSHEDSDYLYISSDLSKEDIIALNNTRSSREKVLKDMGIEFLFLILHSTVKENSINFMENKKEDNFRNFLKYGGENWIAIRR